jgi:spore coat polysaccharide biosynthesis protein SpsF
MKVVGVIQARMSSSRLPGKALLSLVGKPTLAWLVDAVKHADGLDGVVLATSADSSDDALADFARRMNIPCLRGPLQNVARRLLLAGEGHDADAIVRLSGDSPLMDPSLIEHAVRLFRNECVDVVSNVRPRSFPKGESVEVISLAALRRVVDQMSEEESEHVTLRFYSHVDASSIRSFQADRPRPEVQLSIDEHADFLRCAAIIEMLQIPPWRAGWQSCVDAYDATELRLGTGNSS